MRVLLLAMLAIVLLSTSLEAQTVAPCGAASGVNPLSRLAWDMAAPDPTDAAGSLAAVRAYTVKRYVDTATAGIPLIGVSCVGPTVPATLIACSVPLPALPLGAHRIQLSATGADGAESGKSTPCSFTLAVSAGVPSTVRLTP